MARQILQQVTPVRFLIEKYNHNGVLTSEDFRSAIKMEQDLKLEYWVGGMNATVKGPSFDKYDKHENKNRGGRRNRPK